MRCGLAILAIAAVVLWGSVSFGADKEKPKKETDIAGYGAVKLGMLRDDVVALGYDSTTVNGVETLVKIDDPLEIAGKKYLTLVGVTTSNLLIPGGGGPADAITVLFLHLSGQSEASTCYEGLRKSLLDKYDPDMVVSESEDSKGKIRRSMTLRDADGDTIDLALWEDPNTPNLPSSRVVLKYAAGHEASSKL